LYTGTVWNTTFTDSRHSRYFYEGETRMSFLDMVLVGGVVLLVVLIVLRKKR
jgi:hypothetical protein